MKKIISAIFILMSCISVANATVLHFRSDLAVGDVPGSLPYYNTAAGGGLSVNGLLINEGLNNPAYETADTTFTVVGTGTISVTFNFLVDTGTFNGHFGFYDVNAITADPLDSAAYRAEVASIATQVFNDNVDKTKYIGTNLRSGGGTSVTIDLQGGTELGFVLWPNGLGSQIMLSDEDYNFFNQMDQMLAFIGGGKTLFTFADRYYDDDYTDLSFSIETEFLVDDITPTVEASAPGSLALMVLGLAGLVRISRNSR